MGGFVLAVKDELRRRLLEARAAVGAHDRSAAEAAVARRLMQVPEVAQARVLLGYVAIRGELDLRGFLLRRQAEGVVVALPRMEGHRMEARRWRTGDDLEVVRGIPQPLATAEAVGTPHVALVPGTGFDKAGHRLGYGLGHFDRFLGQQPSIFRVGVAFDVQLVEQLPREGHDEPMDCVVTPSQLIRATRTPTGRA